MSSETLINRLSEKPKSLENYLRSKEEKLPKGIRIYIRRLKESGEWDKAIYFREEFLKGRISNRQQRAEKELNKTIIELIETDDPLVQSNCEVKAVWLMYAAGILQSDERINQIIEILDSKGADLKRQLEENLPTIRDAVKDLLPMA